MAACEPCQVRNEAALSNVSHVSLLAWLFYTPVWAWKLLLEVFKNVAKRTIHEEAAHNLAPDHYDSDGLCL